MNEHQLGRLLHRIVLSAALPLAVLGAACGGSAVVDQPGGAGNSANGGSSSVGGGAGAGGSACRSTAQLYCGGGLAVVPKTCIDSAMATAGTALPLPTCMQICNVSNIISCSVAAADATSVSLQCVIGCAVGRRPAGLCEPLSFDNRDIGGYLADVSRLEAASVASFQILRDELYAHGAPKRLVRAATRAAKDEIRHTRATRALARRFGAQTRPAAVERRALRPIEAMAVENAVEGCVRETYGSLLATRQAQRARDPRVRAVMMRIARDETRHASLSWRVARWLETRLDPDARRNVERAKQAAVRELMSSAAHDRELAFADLVGLPAPAESARLVAQMKSTLWS